MLPKPHHHVVAAVIERDGQVFCTRRGKTKYEYTSFKYEFPGGKVEEGETEQEALVREIHEELFLDISVERLLMKTSYDYPDFSVSLSFYLCHTRLDGDEITVHPEHPDAVWQDVDNLVFLDWVAADLQIARQMSELLSTEEHRMVRCLNCGRMFESMYCPDCGQKRTVKRYNWKGVLRSVTNGLLSPESGFLYTVKELFLRPGPTTRNYLEGKRIRIFSPFPFMFLTGTIFAAASGIRHALYPETSSNNLNEALSDGSVTTQAEDIREVGEAFKAMSDTLRTSGNVKPSVPDAIANIGERLTAIDTTTNTTHFNSDAGNVLVDVLFPDNNGVFKYVITNLKDNYGFLMLLLMPVTALVMRWTFGKRFRKTYNWPETYVINAFLCAQVYLLMACFAIASWFTPDNEWVSKWSFLSVWVLIIWYMKIYTPEWSIRKRIRRIVSISFAIAFLSILVISVFAVLVALLAIAK